MAGRPPYKMYKLLVDTLYCSAPYTERVTPEHVIIDTNQWMIHHHIKDIEKFNELCEMLLRDGYWAKCSRRYSRTTVQLVLPPEGDML